MGRDQSCPRPETARLAALQSPLRLERLIRDAGFGRGYQRDLYAQAWALVYFLRIQKAGQFLTFIDLLRNSDLDGQPNAQPPGDRVFDAFQRALGTDLERLDDEWHKFMKTVQTPLEQNGESGEEGSKTGRGRRTAQILKELTGIKRSVRSNAACIWRGVAQHG